MAQVSNQFRRNFEEGNINETGEGRQLRPAERGENRGGVNRITKGGIRERLGQSLEPMRQAREELGREKGRGIRGIRGGIKGGVKGRIEGGIGRIGGGDEKKGFVGGVKSVFGLGKGEQKPKPKIYFIEILAILPILILADIFDWFSLTGAGAVLSWVIDILATGILSTWLFLRKRKVGWSIAMGFFEMAPIAELITIRSVILIIFIIIDKRKNKKLREQNE